MIIQQNTSRPKSFTVLGGVSSKRKTTLRFVAPGTKVNSNYYINKVLKAFLTRGVPRLFPKKTKNKMVFSSRFVTKPHFQADNSVFERKQN